VAQLDRPSPLGRPGDRHGAGDALHEGRRDDGAGGVGRRRGVAGSGVRVGGGPSARRMAATAGGSGPSSPTSIRIIAPRRPSPGGPGSSRPTRRPAASGSGGRPACPARRARSSRRVESRPGHGGGPETQGGLHGANGTARLRASRVEA
jgi:hypothetical protein